MKTPMNYTVIESGAQSMSKEIDVFGHYGAMRYQTAVFVKMDYLCDGAYTGGVWELRQYENGAVAWIFPQEGQVQTHTFNGFDPECNFEGVAIAANLIAMSGLMQELTSRKASDAMVENVARNAALLERAAKTFEQWKAIRQIID